MSKNTGTKSSFGAGSKNTVKSTQPKSVFGSNTKTSTPSPIKSSSSMGSSSKAPTMAYDTKVASMMGATKSSASHSHSPPSKSESAKPTSHTDYSSSKMITSSKSNYDSKVGSMSFGVAAAGTGMSAFAKLNNKDQSGLKSNTDLGLKASSSKTSPSTFNNKNPFEGKKDDQYSTTKYKNDSTLKMGTDTNKKTASPDIKKEKDPLLFTRKNESPNDSDVRSKYLLNSENYKNYATNSYSIHKNNKPSTRFGFIWLPIRKRNKKKNVVYNPLHKNLGEKSPTFHHMSGDSPDYDLFKKKEDPNLLVAERKLPAATVASASAVTIDAARDNEEVGTIEEKQEFIKHDLDDSKKAAGGDSQCKNDNDYGKEIEPSIKAWETDRLGDKVDSVYLRAPPPHKVRRHSATSLQEEEDCGVKCLYYTLQCCDCVLM